MSKLCDSVLETLRGAFPHITIKTEEFVEYKGQKLFLDIWMPQLNLIVEVHGPQHDSFIEHFHGTAEAFMAGKRRDRLKEEWADLQNYTFIVLREKDLPITADNLLSIIVDGQNE